ncbi:phytanoyl-CoA dioxygenase family protein [Cohnella endophytica]|uniref:Phytanoyl-CoA dioxygenase family protein n=1 Tax=Cohnella endophytica TaxID=2419778 RepID=A0A494XTK2_9BACL|nr:phytanoyl-CoA dioxygenase family protein [Cohnella endophytica]RKP52981.1 phytanoyl-CoA dioxygenase family protein [Cohnella endophytica]
MSTVHAGQSVILTEEQMKHYGEQGYIIFEELFSNEEMDRVRGLIDAFDEESERELREKERNGDFISTAGKINFTANLNFRHPRLQRFSADQRFVDITTAILGPDTKLYWDQSVYKRPEADRDFPWHQDNGYAPTSPVHYLTCWLALEDTTIENGCIWVKPGSHRQGFVKHVKTDIGWVCYFGEDPGIPVELKKGSMVAFHSLLFHRSTPNLSKTTTRKGYVLQYSVDGSFNPDTNQVYRNGPLIARGGVSAYTGFVPQEYC